MIRRDFLIIGHAGVGMAQTFATLTKMDHVIIVKDTGNPHDDIRAGIEIMKNVAPKVIEAYTNVQQAIDEIKRYKPDFNIEIVKNFAEQTSHSYEDLISGIRDRLDYVEKQKRSVDFIALTNHSLNDIKFQLAEIEDSRPWYEKAACKGGKKRKQNYHNRQPWRK